MFISRMLVSSLSLHQFANRRHVSCRWLGIRMTMIFLWLEVSIASTFVRQDKNGRFNRSMWANYRRRRIDVDKRIPSSGAWRWLMIIRCSVGIRQVGHACGTQFTAPWSGRLLALSSCAKKPPSKTWLFCLGLFKPIVLMCCAWHYRRMNKPCFALVWIQWLFASNLLHRRWPLPLQELQQLTQIGNGWKPSPFIRIHTMCVR